MSKLSVCGVKIQVLQLEEDYYISFGAYTTADQTTRASKRKDILLERIRAKLECMKIICVEKNGLYEKQHKMKLQIESEGRLMSDRVDKEGSDYAWKILLHIRNKYGTILNKKSKIVFGTKCLEVNNEEKNSAFLYAIINFTLIIFMWNTTATC